MCAKMNVLFRFMFLIFTSKISTIWSQSSPASAQTGPGPSSCIYYGSVDQSCNFKPVALSDLPQSCSSFIFESLTVDTQYSVYHTFFERSKVLNELCKSGKQVYVNYGHMTYGEWSLILACMSCDETNAVEESVGINSFLKCHPGITGLYLRNLTPRPWSKEFVGMTANLLKYIEVIKRETGLQIGITINADDFMDYYEKQPFPWLDFPTLDPCVDSYIISLTFFNTNCTAEMRNTGVTPLNGNEKYTLEKLSSAIKKSKIPKEKIYFKFELNPVSENIYDSNPCTVNFQMMCMFPSDALGWCSDTLQTFYEKGQWVKLNGNGFIGANVDLDDPQSCCNCGPYPGFNAILAGLNGCPTVPKCPQLDRS